MTPDAFASAMQSLLEDTLSETEHQALNERLRSDADARVEFARQMKLHALLQWRGGRVTTVAAAPRSRAHRFMPQTVWSWAGWAAAAMLALGTITFVLSPSPATAAITQMLAAWESARDRTYTIHVLEGDPQLPLKSGRSVSYEDAKVHLRGSRQFVLIRQMDSDEEAITGSDGVTHWDIRGKSPVRVSYDSHRFRGALPGEQQDVPLLDLPSLLHFLRHGYELESRSVPHDDSVQLLKATRKSREVRGPREMAFTYRRESGVLVRIELHGLPRTKGGPTSVALVLTDESVLPADFFTHFAHHEPERGVINESAEHNP